MKLKKIMTFLGDFVSSKKESKKIETDMKCGVNFCEKDATHINQNGLIGFYFTCEQHKGILNSEGVEE